MGHTSEQIAQFLPQIYAELRALAQAQLRKDRVGHTLQPTALVHEVLVRLLGSDLGRLQDELHLRALAAQAMRRVLIDYARAHGADKRGGERNQISLHEGLVFESGQAIEFLTLQNCLEELGQLSPRQLQVVELRFFGGLTEEEVAQFLGVSVRTVVGDWRMARAWLRKRMMEKESRES